jgi:hypothetical protein
VTERGRSLREAISIALELVNVDEFLSDDKRREALREHVLRWVHSYAENRGVIFTDEELLAELESLIAARGGGPCG